ncbi:MAG TPA: carbohydrate-binding protein, partial [Humisphaera sp.]
MRERKASVKQPQPKQQIRTAARAGLGRPAGFLEPLERRVLFAAAYQQDAGSTGIVAFEAEAYDATVAQGGKAWTAYTATAGYSGAGAVQATPNTGTLLDSGFLSTSPRLDFAVNFVKTGVHYVWVRGFGATGNDDSLHVGIDGAAPATSDRLALANNSYGWAAKTMDGGAVATINVTTPGVHTVNVWMREDGVVADKVLLTTSAAYAPTGTGPAASARVTVGGLPTVTVGATDASAAEAGLDPGMVTFVRTAADVSQPLTVRYTVGGTATNGADYAALGGTVTIPAGATSAAVNVMPVDDALAEGPETVAFAVAADAAYAIGSAASATVTIADNDTTVPPPPPPPASQTPYGGTSWAVPGQIEAENFDNGGEGVAYHDVDATNLGGQYRSTGVDLESVADAGAGVGVGHIAAGEWLEYTVNVAAAGTYDLGLRFASGSAGGTAHLEVDGADVSGPVALPNTGGWTTWTTVTKAGLSLPAGAHVLRLAFDASNGGEIGVLNWLKLSSTTVPPPPPPPPSGPSPYGGTPWPVGGSAGGQVEAENYDVGGEGVAYHDADPANLGGAYRADGVDVEPTTDAGGGYAVGHVAAGEWLEYTVSVAAAGAYDVSARVAADVGYGGTFHVEVDGANVTGPMSFGSTGGWQSYATVTRAGVSLPAGTHVVRVAFDAANSGGDLGNLNWLKFAPATVSPPVVPPPPPTTQAPASPFVWTSIAASPIARGEGQSAVVNGKL